MSRLLLLPALAAAVLLGPVGPPASGAAVDRAAPARHARSMLLGNQHVMTSAKMAKASRVYAFPFVAVRSGVARSVRLYVGHGNGASGLIVALYTNAHGHPAALRSEGTLSHPAAGRWDAVAIRHVRVKRGTHYWLAVLARGGPLAYRSRTGPRCRATVVTRTRVARMPGRWKGWKHVEGCSLSAYVSAIPARRGSPTGPVGVLGGGGGSGSSGGSGSGGGGAGTGLPIVIPANGCFPAPGACGLPDPTYHNVGATSACSSLPASGSITVSTAGSTIADRNVTGTIVVNAANVTIQNVCVTTNGGGQLGSRSILLQSGADNTLLRNVTIAGANQSGQSVDQAVANNSGGPATATGLYASNCGECLWNGPWTVSDSYVITNGMQGTSDHLEDIYLSDSTATLNHDVLLDPSWQNSTIFGDTQWGGGGPCDNHWTITNSLLAGGGFVIYTCGNASSAGSSTMNISNNRFARCTTGPFHYNASTGGTACQGATQEQIGAGADSHGYWPDGGYFGIKAWTYCTGTAQVWAANVWDDNGAAAACA